MTETNTKKLATPPYVAYRTLRNFLEGFQQGTPGRIERSAMGGKSGAVQSQLMTALRFLGFVSENNVPLDVMKKFVTGDAAAQGQMMGSILRQHYPFIFSDDFDFATATGSMVRERFEEHTSATGETVARCINFLKDAAQDAGIQVSPFLSHKNANGPKKRSATAGGQRKTERPAERPTNESGTGPSVTNQPQIAAQSSLLLWGLFQRLPKPGSVWPKTDRDQWTETLNNVLMLEYKEQ
ncbi:MAG TPA: DUF5343 domain-containing protein [Bryobacteraceae bacterium]|jgi:hypothetical protein